MVELVRRGSVTGVEVSDTSVCVARARDAGEVISGSVLQMPFESASFDLSVCLDVIEHLEDDLSLGSKLQELKGEAEKRRRLLGDTVCTTDRSQLDGSIT